MRIHPVKLLRIGKAEFNGVNANAANKLILISIIRIISRLA